MKEVVQAEEEKVPVRYSTCKIQTEGLYEAKIRYFFSRFLFIY